MGVGWTFVGGLDYHPDEHGGTTGRGRLQNQGGHMTVLRSRRNALRLAVATLVAMAVALTFTAPAGRPGHGPAIWHPPVQHLWNGTSLNWAGYDAVTGPYTEVSANWTQPSVSCAAGETSYSSFWAGLDGGASGDGTVEQTGTDADCSGGTPVYYAWYEMYPKYPVNLNAPVRPGDSMAGVVVTSGNGVFQLAISDRTQGWTSQVSQHLHQATLQTAEVIAEAPSSRAGVLALADFGTVSFSASLTDNAPLGDANPVQLVMVSGNTVKAQPSALSGGQDFSVTWEHS